MVPTDKNNNKIGNILSDDNDYSNIIKYIDIPSSIDVPISGTFWDTFDTKISKNTPYYDDAVYDAYRENLRAQNEILKSQAKAINERQKEISPLDLSNLAEVSSKLYSPTFEKGHMSIFLTEKSIYKLNYATKDWFIDREFYDKIKDLNFDFILDSYNEKMYFSFKDKNDLAKYKILYIS